MIAIVLRFDNAASLCIGISREDIVRMALEMEEGATTVSAFDLDQLSEAVELDVPIVHVQLAIAETEQELLRAIEARGDVDRIENFGDDE